MNPRGLLLALLLGLLPLGCTREASVVRQLPEAVRPDAARVVEGNTAFACDLYQRLRGGPGNLFLSPFSISTALAMTYGGARGITESEMAAVLHFPLGKERLHPVFHELLKSVDAGVASSGYRLDVANRLWGQSGRGFLPAYLELTRNQYEAELETVDFAGQAEASRARINRWVEEKTRQEIKGLLPPGSLDISTVLLLTSAVYFRGKWQARFDAGQTRPGAFHVTPTQSVTVPMMRQAAEVAVGYAAGARVLELPYAGRDLSMIILLPVRYDGLVALEDSLSLGSLALWRSVLRPGKVDVVLPRFTVTSVFSLGRTLQGMGMATAFTPAADFSGMNGTGQLAITDALHKALLSVNEEGTEAAAATAVVLGKGNGTPEVRVDHPFLFLIRDNVTGSILFLGRVVDPTAGG